MTQINANLINFSANHQMESALIINKTELERTVSEVVLTVFEEIKNAHPPTREIMTLSQLAEYWQVTRQSLLKWSRRDEFRLPVHYVGGDPRFHLSEVNLWSKEEAMRKLHSTGKSKEVRQ